MSFKFVNNTAPFPTKNRSSGAERPSSMSSGAGHRGPPTLPLDRALPEYGTPNEMPNPPTHYFPSRPGAKQRVQRLQQQQQQLDPHSGTHPLPSEHAAAPTGQDAASATASPPRVAHSHASYGAQATVTGGPTTEAERVAIQALVGAYGATSVSSTRHRSPDRNMWDAASELMREERAAKRKASSHDDDGRDDDDEEDQLEDDRDTQMQLDDDAASTRSDQTGNAKTATADKDGAPKKRSRTLTTAHQTAVLNALLAKTRFPSTETREEVGKQIGMSARRVQIWFQNRRQSQKRQRDREASEIGAFHSTHVGPSAHQLHYEYQHQQQRMNPYGRDYPPAPPTTMSSSSSTSTARPEITRQTSIDSVNSYSSARSSMGSFHVSQAHRDVVPPLSDVPPRWPANGQPMYSNGWHTQQRTAQSPLQSPTTSSTPQTSYFPRHPQTRPAARDADSGRGAQEGADAAVKLPPLSAIIGGTLPDSPGGDYGTASTPRQATFTSTFANRPPPPAPSAGTRAIPNSQIMSPMSPVSFAPSDSFSRLRISSEGPGSPPTRHASPPDMLDAVMETMSRPTNIVPARASLPPLRYHPRPSEADAALLAPILPAGASTSSKPKQLPPISSITSSLGLPFTSPSSSSSPATTTTFGHPTHPFPPRERSNTGMTTNSHLLSSSAGSHNSQSSKLDVGRSSVSSFETLGTGWTPASMGSSSRTSFSSEVQDEWDRVSREQNSLAATGGRKVKAVEVSPWDDRRGMARPLNLTPQPNH
ncbi:hypothetical protein OIV83_002288 [Microbotryomycetes sp. JL201]|nr:hypothetical protein OIV83_002288 [Microbotryomycetes sp. JL201]